MESQNLNEFKDLVSEIKAPWKNAKKLKLAQSELEYLCDAYDPYSGNPDKKVLKLLKKYHLETFIGDPFQLTNKILVLLDEIAEEFKIKENTDS
ncbi:MAG: hypothetical protein HOE90_06395 [Bacteriovoracaceae bacterium]|jgi:hypothetical protein|nr:hypothetical protein [Bacteriovoracaceae bacterium]